MLAAGQPPWVIRLRSTLTTGVTAFTLLAASGCADSPINAVEPGGSAPSRTSTPLPITPPDAADNDAATAQVDLEDTARSVPSGACRETVGALLRERTTVSSNGLVTILSGAPPCPAVGLWAVSFSLDADPSLDPPPQFGAAYTGTRQLAIRLPAASRPCTAAAVFFAPDAAEAQSVAVAAQTAAQVRRELSAWPAGATRLVPGGRILRGRSSPVLAATVVGDPSACTPGESVSSPFATAGDCWAALPGAPEAAAETASGLEGADDATRFRRTTCGEPHTHEVYWAEGLTPRQYLDEGRPAALGAAAWARRRAGEVCAKRSAGIALTSNVTRADIYLEYLWPATLAYPPVGTSGWSKAQVVCLARWKDGRATDQRLLRP